MYVIISYFISELELSVVEEYQLEVVVSLCFQAEHYFV